jgi:hypothetical protein
VLSGPAAGPPDLTVENEASRVKALVTVKPQHSLVVRVSAASGTAILLALVLAGSAPSGATGGPVGGSGTSRAARTSPGYLTVAGSASADLRPGLMVPLDVEITNLRRRPMIVGRVTVMLGLVRAPHAELSRPCTPHDFIVRQASIALEVTVPAQSTRRLSQLGVVPARWPGIGMVDRPVNQDGCQGSTVALTYTAIGRLGW